MRKYLAKKYGIEDSVEVPAVDYIAEELLVSNAEAAALLKRKYPKKHMLPFGKVCKLIEDNL